MEPKIQSSFIPDKMPSTNEAPAAPKSKLSDGSDIFLIISIVVFAVSFALAAGVFLYDKYMVTSAEAKSEQLSRERTLLEPTTIRELMRLDTRLVAAEEILSSHIAPSVLFGLLEDLTLKSVYFRNLEYSSSGADGFGIEMQGKASTVNGVALQADIFGNSHVIINPIFSDLNLAQDGVGFNVTATIDRDALSYTAAAGTYDINSEININTSF